MTAVVVVRALRAMISPVRLQESQSQLYKNQGKSRFRAVSAVKGGDGNAKRNDGASANAAVAHA